VSNILIFFERKIMNKLVYVALTSLLCIGVRSSAMSPLHEAAEVGDISQIEALLRSGADVNAYNEDGKTPLNVAARMGHKNIVQTFLDHGADINARDKRGRTPLYFAVLNGNLAGIQLLLDRGADLNIGDKDGRTPLDLAALNDQQDAIELLQNYLARQQAARQEILTLLPARHPRTGAQSPARDLQENERRQIFDLLRKNY
jgi:ankyrin repeat protein